MSVPLYGTPLACGEDKLKNQTALVTPRSFFTAAGRMNDTDL
jgi:hypothetical protein